MDVAVLGATGDVGRQVVTRLVDSRVLPTSSRLQLVGRPDGSSGRAVHGLRADLMDAYDEHAPLLDVALRPQDVVADIVVMAAGRTNPARPGVTHDRSALAEANVPVFRAYAEALAEHGSGHEVVVVVTNPVELAVGVLAETLGRHRVIGMGAWLDTLRFRREVAVQLGVRRHRVGGFVAGQHGEDIVPLWSSVRISGLDVDERRRAVARLRGGRTLDTFPTEIADAKSRLAALAEHDIGAAFALIDTWPADLQTAARPWMTHQSGAKTPAGTAAATADLVATILDGRDIVVAGQVALDGEVAVGGRPVHGVLGVPVVLGSEGWTRVLLDELAPDEDARLTGVVERIAAGVDPYLRGETRPTVAPTADASAVPAAPDPTPDLAPGTDPDDTRWVARIDTDHRTGAIAALAAVFATRGVNVDSLRTDDTADGAEAGTVVVAFRADERRCRVLVRSLERLAVVRTVDVRVADA
ncbi:lactate/malate family dehydrogenase [Cellulomonas soli]|uniref:lactate/malate family dehydrogenase n=1 Tax=Cellulomonas soli TaxID=931535 RepID=UPI003F83B95F